MIGVFDSGHGGLTILRALVTALPDRSFLYLGDHAHMPYGERTSPEILALTERAMETLFAQGCRLVILGCNTAAAVALRTLQQQWLPQHYPDRRILGVLVPTVELATGVAWADSASNRQDSATTRTIAIFATRRTVASNVYPEEIRKRAPEIAVVQQACAGLVNLIERSAPHDELDAAVKTHVAALMVQLEGRRPDAVVLGCTHYPLVADLFAAHLPPGSEILSQPTIVAASLKNYLQRHPNIDAPGAGELTFLTTGERSAASHFATTFFGKPVAFQTVQI